MNLLGISLTTWSLGLAGLASALLALHLLRVRLRRQTVDSLLFFRQVGAVRKPRVLLGLPARWLSFALGLLLLAALWTAFARPRIWSDQPSRVVVVDASSTAMALQAGGTTVDGATVGGATVGARLVERAAELVEEGLGPRGRVIAFGTVPGSLWAWGEPVERIGERAATRGDGETSLWHTPLWNTLADAAHDLRPGDEIVLLGGPQHLPPAIDGIPLRRSAAVQTGPTPTIVAVWARNRGGRFLEVDVATGGVSAIVDARRGDDVLAEARVETAVGESRRVELGPLPADALTLRVGVRTEGGARSEVEVSLPEQRPLRVYVAPGLPDAVRLALEASSRCTIHDGATADVAIVRAGDPAPELPCLVIDPGIGSGPRAPRVTAACPLPLGLRDRARPDAAALRAGADAEVWVEDATSGAPLLISESSPSGRRIRTAEWLLDGTSHRDVPVLVLGALRSLAPSQAVEVRPALAYRPGGPASPQEFEVLGGAFPLLPVLLAAGLLLLAIDVWLHHRGRIA